MTVSQSIHIRGFEASDTEMLMRLFYDTVHQINCRDYTPEQLKAWAPQTMDAVTWHDRLCRAITLVAVQHDQPVGFCELERGGHIGCFYSHHRYQGQGIGTALLHQAEAIAHQHQWPQLWTEASITAKPFFERHGFQVLEAQQVERCGVILDNYRMQKTLVYSTSAEAGCQR